MFARSVAFQLKPGRASEFTKVLETDVIPVLRKQKGFQDEITFVADGERKPSESVLGSEGERGDLRAGPIPACSRRWST